jgi:hypothetical protein
LSISPAPTASVNRPSDITATVAAAWAMMIGWYRVVGQVIPVAMPMRSVRSAIAPRTLHAKGLCSCSGSHGWMWSEMATKSRPISSAALAWRTSSEGDLSSLMSFNPKLTTMRLPSSPALVP